MFFSQIKKIYKGYKTWTELLIFIVSLVFAINTLVVTLLELTKKWNSFLLIIIIAALFIFYNFFSKKKSIPNIFMGIALFIFIIGFFISDFHLAWQKSLDSIFAATIEATVDFVGITLLFVVLSFPILLILYSGDLRKKLKENHSFQLIFYILIFIFTGLVFYFSAPILEDQNQNFKFFAEKMIIFIVGFIPIHWFYETIICHFFPERSFIKSYKKIASFIKEVVQTKV